MKKTRIMLVLVLTVLAVALCACSSEQQVEKYVGYMNDSALSVNVVTSDIKVKDGETLVYAYTRKMTISGSSATVETSESKLNSSFELATVTDVEQMQNVDRKTLVPVSIAVSSITDIKTSKNGFDCVIPAQNFASVLKLGYYDKIDGNAALSCGFNGKKLAYVRCAYVTESGKNVSVEYNFSY